MKQHITPPLYVLKSLMQFSVMMLLHLWYNPTIPNLLAQPANWCNGTTGFNHAGFSYNCITQDSDLLNLDVDHFCNAYNPVYNTETDCNSTNDFSWLLTNYPNAGDGSCFKSSKCLPVAILRPFSAGGARGFMFDAMQQFGADSLTGRLACLFEGAAETTFYVIAVYFGAVNVKDTRCTLGIMLLVDLVCVITATIVCSVWFR